jgi:Protein of unknown function (DUF2865)
MGFGAGFGDMVGTAITRFLYGLGVSLPIALLCLAPPAAAQYGNPPQPQNAVPNQAPGGGARNPSCMRLESQLAVLDRGGGVDPAKAAEIKRYEDASGKTQAELDRLSQQSQRMGCSGGGFFSLFSGQSPQCVPLNNQIQQVRANLDRYLAESQRLQGNSGEREGQRRGLLVALGQNDCGPQYRQYANAGPGGFFEQLFGGNPAAAPDAPPAGTYRTLCVRTCDGYYFPVSYSTVPSKFADDERQCQRMCPATEAQLFTYRNPGEDMARATSLSGDKPYSELPNAFSYRKQYNAACSCRAPGQSWADALRQGDDQTLERGDIVVTEERAKQLSQPRVDAQGRPVSLDPNSGRPGAKTTGAKQASNPQTGAPPPVAAPAAIMAPEPPAAADASDDDPSKRKVRAVGPATSYPVR